MLNVFITVDTEIWLRKAPLTPATLREAIDRDIHGRTPRGDVGLGFQLDVLDAHGLKAVFLVESLFASAVGPDPLRDIVQLIRGRGHDVQLHLHTEWLEHIADCGLRIADSTWSIPSAIRNPKSAIPPYSRGQHIRRFTLDEQTRLVETALKNLIAAGADHVCAFRAGNYGANLDTLTALARNGINYDTSHNACFLGKTCDIRTDEPLLQPRRLNGVLELPVSVFEDGRGRLRPAQLTACSSGEMRAALETAHENGWNSFVIVSHSFELLRWRLHHGHVTRPDRIMVRRFERLCRFLADNADTFRTATFADLAPDEIGELDDAQPIRSTLWRTAGRYSEQFLRRCLA